MLGDQGNIRAIRVICAESGSQKKGSNCRYVEAVGGVQVQKLQADARWRMTVGREPVARRWGIVQLSTLSV